MGKFVCFNIRSLYLLIIWLSLLIGNTNNTYSQEKKSAIKGVVNDPENEVIEYATVFLRNTQYGTTTNEEGNFYLKVPPGHYTLCIQMIGYIYSEQEIEVASDEIKNIQVLLKNDVIELDEVDISGQSIVKQVNKTAYNVIALDTKKYYNNTTDIAHVLDNISGVKIKELGGVGSETQISLNGFSGKHVKIFMDGVPMDGSGSSMQLNKMPVSIADRIEVYKGVVPVELGADALGGAINIITKKTKQSYIDASYTFGSFNTHKSNLSLGHTTDNGVSLQLSVYQNYSDNNYKVKTKLLDLETNTYSKNDYWFKRFHDNYHNEAIIGKIGLVDKKWASKIMIETTLSQEKADIQNANLMKIVFGGKMRKAKSIIPAFYYEKNDLFTSNLNFSLSAKYNIVKSNNIDTLARQYNWRGDYRIKTVVGESEYTLSEYTSSSGYYVCNLKYKLCDKQVLSLNNVYSHFSRKASDAAANYENSTEATFMKRTNKKNITGLSYKYDSGKKWNALLFGKYYDVNVTGPVDISSTSSSEYEQQKRSFNTLGYGLASSLTINPAIQLKGSFEKSYRLPTENELFGDEVLETGDASLKAENSNNINFNISYNNTIKKRHSMVFEAGFIYRLTKDYIRRIIEQKYGGAYYTNHGQVLTLGVDMDIRYFYKKKFAFGTNVTYQDIRNKERYSATGQKLIYYNDRMPNVPYMFSNTDVTYNFFNVLGKENQLAISYSAQYVHDFFRSWESEGGEITIPAQLSQDVNLNYSLKNGRYNISFEAKNITNENLYDNYSLQKAGQSFYLKLRCYLFKN